MNALCGMQLKKVWNRYERGAECCVALRIDWSWLHGESYEHDHDMHANRLWLLNEKFALSNNQCSLYNFLTPWLEASLSCEPQCLILLLSVWSHRGLDWQKFSLTDSGIPCLFRTPHSWSRTTMTNIAWAPVCGHPVWVLNCCQLLKTLPCTFPDSLRCSRASQ